MVAVPILIRPYQASDRESVIQLWQGVFGYGAAHNSPALSLERKLSHSPELLFVAESAGEILGTVMGGYDGHRGWVYSLAVESLHRHQGIGTQLMRMLETELMQLGCVKINLQLLVENSETVAFYQQLGYQMEERISMGKRLHT